MTTEMPSNDPFAERRAWWEFLQSSLIGAAGELRMTLPLDEVGFLRVAGYSHADARDFFLYGVLDEIQKAAIAMAHWVELLGPDQDFSDLAEVDQIERAILESVIDDQSLRMRKLVEVLVTLINFERTNEDVYYRHYLLLADLEAQLSAQADRAEFFGAPSRNIGRALQWTRERIAEIEAGELERDRCWYAREGGAPGRVFRSTRMQLKSALEICEHAERVALGFSYGAFSALSGDVHFSVAGRMALPRWEQIAEGIGRVGVLGLVALVRCQILMNIVPDGRSRQIRDAFDNNEFIPEHVHRVTVGAVEIGDFVLAAGDLAEVAEVKTSTFGYRSYRVAYLAERPLEEVDDDWFPAFAVRRLYGRSDWVEALRPYVDQGVLSAEDFDYVKRLPKDLQQDALRDSLVATWEAGLREAIQQHPPDVRP